MLPNLRVEKIDHTHTLAFCARVYPLRCYNQGLKVQQRHSEFGLFRAADDASDKIFAIVCREIYEDLSLFTLLLAISSTHPWAQSRQIHG
eukprot:IDg2736t1